MHHPPLVHHRVRIRRQRAPQRHSLLQLAHLREVDDTQRLCLLDRPRRWLQLAGQQPQQRRLAAAIRSHQPHTHAVRDEKIQPLHNLLLVRGRTKTQRHILKLHQPLRLPVGRRKIDSRRRRLRPLVHVAQLPNQVVCVVDAGLRLGRPRLRPAPQPLHLNLHAVLQRILQLRLCLQVCLPPLDKLRVAALHAQQSLGVNLVQLYDLRRYVLQKVAVVAHHHAGKRRIVQQRLQPGNARQIQVVRRFVQQQHIRVGNNRFRNRQPLSPASAQRRRFRLQRRKAGPPRRLVQPAIVLRIGQPGAIHCGFQHGAHCQPGRKVRLLLHIRNPRPLACRHVACIRLLLARQHRQQRGLPSSIRPNQPNAVPFRHRKSDSLKQCDCAKALRQTLCIQNWRHTFSLPCEAAQPHPKRTARQPCS